MEVWGEPYARLLRLEESVNDEFEWLCQCGETGAATTFDRAYDLAYCHVLETLHARITIVKKNDFVEIVEGIIAEAEAIVQGTK